MDAQALLPSVPVLRGLLFLFALCGGLAWFRRAPRFALAFFSAGALLGLAYWLVQIRFPIGLGTDAQLSREWAQAGVNAALGSRRFGFVWGTEAEDSILAWLAAAGAPFALVFFIPQISALLALAIGIFLPWTLFNGRTAAAFAASLAAAGGLWPGLSHSESFLVDPGRIVVLFLAFVGAVLISHRRGVCRQLKRARIRVAAGLLGVAALLRAFGADAESSAWTPLLLLAASVALASPVRALLRRACSSGARSRGVEAAILAGAFMGSGLFWLDPPATLPGFSEARRSGLAISRPLSWMAQNVPENDVILASREYSSVIATLSGRRVLFPQAGDEVQMEALTHPFRRERLFSSTLDGRPVLRLAEVFEVTHLFLGPGEKSPGLGPNLQTDDTVDSRMDLVLVYQDEEDFRLFRLTKK